jgi:hypothetical protein
MIRRLLARRNGLQEGGGMDLIFLTVLAVFAALTAALIYGCDRLRRSS